MSKKGEQALFRFDGYLISRSLIEIEKNKVKPNREFDITFNPSGIISDKDLNIDLDVSISNKDKSIIISILMNGFFVFEKEIQKEVISGNLCANAIAIMFPYVRAYISNLSSLSGAGTVLLPTLNLSNLGDVLMNNIKEKE
ncbi:MAG: protein-export chaperone SecB [Prevotella sp.]|jgi:preprotein translocase subunit SecB|nr:protein-export chaperone SecB [Prevotella sp.]